MLYIISTPIGNREDITLRALDTLFNVDYLLCEDTRKTQQLLKYYQEKYSPQKQIPKLIPFFEHNEQEKIPQVFSWLKQEKKVGLVSCAGTPIISDPGFNLVQFCQKKHIPLKTIPGVSAITAALSIAGLAPNPLLFLGFLPRKTSKQKKIWQNISQSSIDQTVAFYESAQRYKSTLATIQSELGDINITIARELTKIHEEVRTSSISEWIKNNDIKGELVILFRIKNSKI